MPFSRVEPIPVVGVAPDSDPVVPLAINTQWVEILVGLVEHANWPGFWDGTPTEIDQALSHVIQLAGMMAGQGYQAVQYATVYYQTSGHGGTSVTGWQNRALTSKDDPDDLVTLSSDRFILEAGTYIVRAQAQAVLSGGTQLRLYYEVGPTYPVIGEPGYIVNSGGAGTIGHVHLVGRIVSDGVYGHYLQQYFQYARATYGCGWDIDSGEDNIFAQVELIRIG